MGVVWVEFVTPFLILLATSKKWCASQKASTCVIIIIIILLLKGLLENAVFSLFCRMVQLLFMHIIMLMITILVYLALPSSYDENQICEIF